MFFYNFLNLPHALVEFANADVVEKIKQPTKVDEIITF